MADEKRVAAGDLSPIGATVWEFVSDPATPLPATREFVEYVRSPPGGEGWVVEELDRTQLASVLIRSKNMTSFHGLVETVGLIPADLVGVATPVTMPDAIVAVTAYFSGHPGVWSPEELGEFAQMVPDALVEAVGESTWGGLSSGLVVWTFAAADVLPDRVSNQKPASCTPHSPDKPNPHQPTE